MALTEQKRRYAEERMSGASKKDAAIAAGCPEKTASQAASRYEKDPDVLAFIGRRQVVETAHLDGPPTAKIAASPPASDPLKYFEQVMNDEDADPRTRLNAAKALASFTVAKPGETGKKDQRKADAHKSASEGTFAVPPGPRLAVNNVRKG